VKRPWGPATAAALLASTGACDSRPEPIQRFDPGPIPTQLADGERTYDANCRSCHGPLGTGTEAGPPLVHRIYEPGHHSDAAFQLAVTRGVRAHHWSFGNMPPLPSVDSAEVARVTAYVRWLQRRAGIQ
jgi:cytochrome c